MKHLKKALNKALKKLLSVLLTLVMIAGLVLWTSVPVRAESLPRVGYYTSAVYYDEPNIGDNGIRFSLEYTENSTTEYQVVDENSTEWVHEPDGMMNAINGIYVVNRNVTIKERVTVQCTKGTSVKLIICDGCTLVAEKGITVSEGNTLEVCVQQRGKAGMGETAGRLIAGTTANGVYSGKPFSAGIGGENGENKNCGTVVIHGGTVFACAGNISTILQNLGGAGIGGAAYGSGGDVRISMARVIAYAGHNCSYGGAGIGGGATGKGGKVVIAGGNVSARSGGLSYSGAGIGSGGLVSGKKGTTYFDNSVGDVILIGAEVTARSGDASEEVGGAGIGGGAMSGGGDVTILNSQVKAQGGNGGAGIGGGCAGPACENILIYGGKIETYGGDCLSENKIAVCGAGIGTGGFYNVDDSYTHNKSFNCGTLTVKGGKVEVHGGNSGLYGGDGVGSGGGFKRNSAVSSMGAGVSLIGGSLIAFGGDGENAGIAISPGEVTNAMAGAVWMTRDRTDNGAPIGIETEKGRPIEKCRAAAFPAYTLTLNSNDGTGTTVTRYARSDDKLPCDTFTRDGYVLAGWQDADGTSYAAGEEIELRGDLTLSALWTASSKVAAPVFSPAGGTYTSAQRVTLSCSTEGADIYYTINGSTPTSSDTKYTGEISVSATITIKAIAVKSGMADSDVATETYTIAKASHDNIALDSSVKYGGSNSVDLTSYIEAGGKAGLITTEDPDGILSDEPSLSENELSFTVKDDTDLIGKTAVISLSVEDSDNYDTYTISVTVMMTEKNSQTLTFAVKEITLKIRETSTNIVSGAKTEVTYSSSDENIVTVDETGKVTAIGEGTAEITATAIETDEYYAASDSYVVNVEKEEEDNKDEPKEEKPDKVPLTDPDECYASSEDNFAAITSSGKINNQILDFSKVAESSVDPNDLKMTAIGGSKFTTKVRLKDKRSAKGSGGVKVKVNKKTLIPKIICKKSGSVKLTFEDGSSYTVKFTVEKPKAQKSEKKIHKGSGQVTRTVSDLFGTHIDSGKLSIVKQKHSQATVSDNKLIVNPVEKDSIKVQYKYLDKNYDISIKIK